MFAKLYETDIGQILAVKDTTDNGEPVIRFRFDVEGFGACAVSMEFVDTDTGWEMRNEGFDALDSVKCRDIAENVLSQMSEESTTATEH